MPPMKQFVTKSTRPPEQTMSKILQRKGVSVISECISQPNDCLYPHFLQPEKLQPICFKIMASFVITFFSLLCIYTHQRTQKMQSPCLILCDMKSKTLQMVLVQLYILSSLLNVMTIIDIIMQIELTTSYYFFHFLSHIHDL